MPGPSRRAAPDAPTRGARVVIGDRGRRSRRGHLHRAASLLGLCLAGVTITALVGARQRRRLRPPGQLVELADGRRLHLHLLGPGRGSSVGGDPTIVLEAGSGGTAATMAWLHRGLADHATVVAYDRAGYGFSDPCGGPRDAAAVADDLHAALQQRGLPGPYLLVGHSLGAAYVRVFTARHPDEVVALALLDPVHEEQLRRLPPEAAEALAKARRQLAIAPVLARLGVFRLIDVQRHVTTPLPEDAREQHRAAASSAAGLRAYHREVVAMPELLDELARADGLRADPAFGGRPVVVLSATGTGPGETAAARQALTAMHRELAARSPVAEHRRVEGADHLSLVTDRRHARQVTEAVLGLLATVAVNRRGVPG